MNYKQRVEKGRLIKAQAIEHLKKMGYKLDHGNIWNKGVMCVNITLGGILVTKKIGSPQDWEQIVYKREDYAKIRE